MHNKLGKTNLDSHWDVVLNRDSLLRVVQSQDIPQLDVVPDLKMVQACRVLNNFYEIIKVLKSFEILHTLVCLIDVLP